MLMQADPTPPRRIECSADEPADDEVVCDHDGRSVAGPDLTHRSEGCVESDSIEILLIDRNLPERVVIAGGNGGPIDG